MNRPSVLLALDGWSSSYEDAMINAGFEAIAADRQEALQWLSGEGQIDLAVIDCDRGQPGDEELFTFLHSTQRVPTIVLFSNDIPDWAVDPNPGATKDEYARKPLPPEALVYRLQAMLIHSGREVPGGLPTTAADGSEIETIGEGTVVSLFAP